MAIRHDEHVDRYADYHVDHQLSRRAAHEQARRQRPPRSTFVLSAYGALYSSIRSGVIRPGDQLREDTLAASLSVSRNALRGALQLLTEEGMLTRRPRFGTTVVGGLADVPLDVGVAWGEPGAGTREVTVTDERAAATTPIVRHLLHTDSDRAHLDETVTSVDGRPMAMCTRITLDEGGSRRRSARPPAGDLPEVFEATYGSALAAIDCWIEAKGADERTAAGLGVPVGTLLLAKSRVLSSADGLRREYSISHYPSSALLMSATLRHPIGRIPAPVRASSRAARLGPIAAGARPAYSTADLHTELRAAIREEILGVGERLEVIDLAGVFGADRDALEVALSDLEGEGLVRRTGRAEVTIASPIADYTVNGCTPFRDQELRLFGREHLNTATIPTPPFVAELLESTSEAVDLDEWVVYRAGRPLSCVIHYSERTGENGAFGVVSGQQFHSRFESAYGAAPDRRDVTVRAVTADAQIARRLDVPPGAPLMLVERVLSDATGRPRELSHIYHAARHVSVASHHDVAGVGPAA